MGVTGRIDYYAVVVKAYPLQFINDLTFNIALEIMKGDPWIFFSYLVKVMFKWHVAINIYFPFTKKVEIGAIDDSDLHVTKIGIPPVIPLSP